MNNLDPPEHATCVAMTATSLSNLYAPDRWIVDVAVVGIDMVSKAAQVAFNPAPHDSIERQGGAGQDVAAARIGRFSRKDTVLEDRANLTILRAVPESWSRMGKHMFPFYEPPITMSLDGSKCRLVDPYQDKKAGNLNCLFPLYNISMSSVGVCT